MYEYLVKEERLLIIVIEFILLRAFQLHFVRKIQRTFPLKSKIKIITEHIICKQMKINYIYCKNERNWNKKCHT